MKGQINRTVFCYSMSMLLFPPFPPPLIYLSSPFQCIITYFTYSFSFFLTAMTRWEPVEELGELPPLQFHSCVAKGSDLYIFGGTLRFLFFFFFLFLLFLYHNFNYFIFFIYFRMLNLSSGKSNKYLNECYRINTGKSRCLVLL